MSVRTFIFCDVCNPLGFRCPEQRRATHRGDWNGRRISDARSWFEGDSRAALLQGWILTPQGQHICARCQEQHQPVHGGAGTQPDRSTRHFIFCDCCNPQGIRYIELRRNPNSVRTPGSGRRITDGRAWHEGDDESALAKGWHISPASQYCRQCVERHPEFASDAA